MITEQRIKVNLEDFLRTGVFGAIRFDLTGDQIRAMLGVPNFTFTTGKSHKYVGFEYGDVEFYFISSSDNRLCGIYLDDFDVPKGSKNLILDPWCLQATMSRLEVESALTLSKISFHVITMADPTMEGILTNGGVTLGFIKELTEFSPPLGLYSISRDLRSKHPFI